MDVEFSNLTYSVPGSIFNTKRSRKVILKSISGHFKPGQLSAIMGASGAGKSSLIQALSGSSTAGVRGSLSTNGSPRDEKVFRSWSRYIPSTDLLQPLMTLRELMLHAAQLKLPQNTTVEERDRIVSEIISNMGLTQVEETFTECLSGGQKKRLSIAVELFNNPSVLFLDEPTSGLDNVAAKKCLLLLRTLAQQGHTIVCSIHQPSDILFELLDRVYVMSQGLCVYQGGTTGLLSFLASVGLQCPLSYNPADYVMEVTGSDDVDNIQALSFAIGNGKVIWDGFEAVLNSKSENTKIFASLSKPNLKVLEDHMSTYRHTTSPYKQFITILTRMFLQIGRNKTSLLLQFIQHVVCSTMIGCVFFGGNKEMWYQSQMHCILIMIVYGTYDCCIHHVLNYPTEIKLLQREHFNGWYDFRSYYFALTVSSIPTKMIFHTLFITNIYLIWGLPLEIQRFSILCAIALLTSFTAEGLGYAIGSAVDATNGAIVAPALITSFLGLAIYGLDFAKQIPIYTRVVMKSSFIRNAYVSMELTVFGMDRQPWPCTGELENCLFSNPKLLLQWMDLRDSDLKLELLLLFGSFVLYRVIFYILLRRRLKT